LRDIDLFRPGRDAFASSLTSLDPAFSLKWERGAPLPDDRINTLREFHEAGIYTWVSLEPVLDTAAALEIIRRTHRFVDLYKVGRANYIGLTKTTDWKQFTADVLAVLAETGARHYIKRDLQPYLPEGYDNPMRVVQFRTPLVDEPSDLIQIQPAELTQETVHLRLCPPQVHLDKTDSGVQLDAAKECKESSSSMDQYEGRGPVPTCAVAGCGEPVWARGMCATHYKAAHRESKRSGKPITPAAITSTDERKEQKRLYKAYSNIRKELLELGASAQIKRQIHSLLVPLLKQIPDEVGLEESDEESASA